MARRSKRTRAEDAAADADRLIDDLEEMVRRGVPAPAAATRLMRRLYELGEPAADALARRIIAGVTNANPVTFTLLERIAGDQAGAFFLRIAGAAEAPDGVRLAARRRAGWPLAAGRAERVAFLESLADPEGALVQAAARAGEPPTPDFDATEEVLRYLLALPGERRRAVVGRLATEAGAAAGLLLRGLLHPDDRETQRLVLGALAERGDAGAAAAIRRLAATTRDQELAQAAAAADRLAPEGIAAEGFTLPPVTVSALSSVNGAGGQTAFVGRTLAEGTTLLAIVNGDPETGVRAAFGSRHVVSGEIEELFAVFESPGNGVVPVELGEARGFVGALLAAGARRRVPLPPEFEVWAPLLEDPARPGAAPAPLDLALDDGPYAGRADLVSASGSLIDHDWFATWGFGGDAIAEAVRLVPPPHGRWTERQYRPLIRQLMTPAVQAGLRARLRRQAWVLDRAEDPATRDLTLAVAASLADAGPAELVAHPFVRAMTFQSVETQLALASDPWA